MPILQELLNRRGGATNNAASRSHSLYQAPAQNKRYGEVKVNVAPRQNCVVVSGLKKDPSNVFGQNPKAIRRKPIHAMSAGQTARNRKRRPNQNLQLKRGDLADIAFGASLLSASPGEILCTPQKPRLT